MHQTRRNVFKIINKSNYLKIKNMANLQNFLEKNAVNTTKNLPIAKEFDSIIILLWIFRVIIIGISVYCGYFFFETLLYSHLNKSLLTLITAIVLSCFVEVFGNQFIDKCFKFGLKRQFKGAIALLFAAAIFYGLSFYSATNGLALRQYAKNDTTVLIQKNNSIEIDNLKTDYQNQIAEIQTNIELIKSNPEGWTGAKRNILTASQLNTIKEYNNKIFSLRNDLNGKIEAKNNELIKSIDKTKIHAENESNKFYSICIFIMLFQVITAFLIRFFKLKIYNEVDEVLSKTEKTQNIINKLSDNVWNVIYSRANDLTSIVLSTFNKQSLILKPIEQSAPEPKKITGFKVDNKAINNGTGTDAQLPPEPEPISKNENSINTKIVLNENSNLRTCKHCGNQYVYKHHKQIYCNDNCRAEAWELRTGKKIKYGKK